MGLLAKNKNSEELKEEGQKDKDIIVEHKKNVDKEKKQKETGGGAVLEPSKKEQFVVAIKAKAKQLFESKKRSWEAPTVLKTNLIKGEVTSFFDWKNSLLILVKYLIISFLVIAVTFTALSIWEMNINKKGSDIKDEVDKLKALTAEKEKKVNEISLFHQKVTVAELLLDNHIYWNNFFQFLEENLLEDVYITGTFSGDTSGEYTFSAVAKDYNVMAAQSLILNNLEIVESVEITGGSATMREDKETGAIDSSVDFSFTISLDKNIFLKEESYE